DDDLDAYRKLVIKQRRLEREKVKKDARAPKEDAAPADNKASQKTEKEAARLEAKIAELLNRKQLVEGDMAACYGGAHETPELKRLKHAHQSLEKELATTEAELTKLITAL